MVGVCIGSYIMLGLQYHLFSRIIRYTSVYEVGKSTILMTISKCTFGTHYVIIH